MRRTLRVLADSLTEQLVWWLVGAGALGLLVPAPAAALRPLTPWILAFMIGGLGVRLSLVELAGAFRRWPLVGRGLLAQLLSTPLVAFVLWRLSGGSPLAAGVALQATAPAEITSPLLAHLGGGTLAGALAVMSVSVLLSPLTMPAAARVVFGEAIPVPVGSTLLLLGWAVAVPLLLGSAVRTVTRWKPLDRLGPVLSAGMVVLLIYAVAGGARSASLGLGEIFVLGFLALLLMGIGFGAGWLAGLGGGEADRRTLAFTTGMREFGIATAVALAFFGPEAAVFPAIYGLAMMVGAAWLARRSKLPRSV